jgi:cation diffusion facilitator family transporter
MPVDHALSRSHDHRFHRANLAAEKGTRAVTWITLLMMVVEITAGWWSNSMALLADGWHMSSHAVAIGLSALAYGAARRYAADPRFAFGTWKIEVLGGFASAIFLLGVAALMVFGSVERLVSPEPIHYVEALSITAVGLVVNIVCALILMRAGGHGHAHHGHSHDHAHGHAHGHGDHDHDHAHAHPEESAPQHKDLNLRSAYVHVVADAATSVLALAALAAGWLFGWSWLDPVTGLVGAVIVANWAVGLIRETGSVLLDREMHHPVVARVRASLEVAGDPHETRVTDLHVWRVAQQAYACALTVVSHDASLDADAVRLRLSPLEEIVHSTIEVHVCPGCE